jgi:hypothetical protein
VLARLDAAPEPVRLVVADLSTSPYVDLAGARMLGRLADELAARHATLRVAEEHAEVRDILRAEGLEAKLGPISRRASLAATIEAAQHPDAAEESSSRR